MKTSQPYIKTLAKILKDREMVMGYLNTSLEEGDFDAFLIALRNVAEVHGGLSKIARSAKLNREHLYRMLSRKGNPSMKNIALLLEAMGYKIKLFPLKHTELKKAA